MNRRTALKDLLIIAGGVTLLPGYTGNSNRASIVLSNIKVSAEQEALLAMIAETIIPATDTPGARETGAHLFVLKMLDDCYETKDQQQFLAGLNSMDELSKKRFGISFINAQSTQREELLGSIDKKDKFSPDVLAFYNIMKAETIRGYMTSRYVLLNIVKYEMVPSVKYNGYFPVKNLDKNGRQA